MFDFINKLNPVPNSSSKRRADSVGAARNSYEDEENGNQNPINELQILEKHTDIVRLLVKIDEQRIASASDDGTIILWDTCTGEKLASLLGHTLPITCLLLVDSNRLISGSADKTIRIWNLETYQSLTLKAHEGSIKCIVALNQEKFCSGSNDRQICLWKYDGELVNIIERQEEENLHCMLPIGNRLITGSNSSLLLVYKIDTCTYQRVLAYHRESVRCLVRISAALFASASLDGAVVVWQADTLTPVKVLNNPDKYRNEQRVYIYNVKCLLPLGDIYMAAAIGCGFRIYHVVTGDCIVECRDAHDAEVNHLISLYDGTKIVTCSADACIRVWGFSPPMNFRRPEELGRTRHSSMLNLGSLSRLAKTNRIEAVRLGEMWGHSDCINQLIAITENSFASCSSDTTVILWKDGKHESQIRNEYALRVMTQQILEERRRSQESVEESSMESVYEEEPTTMGEIVMIEDYEVSPIKLEPVPPKQESNENVTKKNVRLPMYIVDYAERLRRDNHYTSQMIADDLRKQGHSEAIVRAVVQKQFLYHSADL